MAVEIRLEQSKFKDKKGAGKWYARTVSTGVVTTEELADSIQENTSFPVVTFAGLLLLWLMRSLIVCVKVKRWHLKGWDDST